jgi:hypothetical protein
VPEPTVEAVVPAPSVVAEVPVAARSLTEVGVTEGARNWAPTSRSAASDDPAAAPQAAAAPPVATPLPAEPVSPPQPADAPSRPTPSSPPGPTSPTGPTDGSRSGGTAHLATLPAPPVQPTLVDDVSTAPVLVLEDGSFAEPSISPA